MRMYKTYAAKFTLTYDALAPFTTFSPLMQQKPCSLPLCFQNLIIVILFSMVAQCMYWKDFRRFCSKTYFSMSQTKSHFTPFHVSALAAHYCLHKIQTLSYLPFFLFRFVSYLLVDLLLVYTPKRNLRSSSDNKILCIPKLRTDIWASLIFFFCPHNMEFFAFRAQTY